MKRSASILLLACLFVLGAIPIATIPVAAAPPRDAGDFPTLTPTITQTPIPMPTATTEIIIVTLNPGTAVPSPTLEGLDPGYPSNIQQEDLLATELAQQQAPQETPRRGNPLITVAYIGLFILLVVGVWMLFSRRGANP